jgi:hypothetical protein
MLGASTKMKLYVNLFLVNTVRFEEKKVLIQTYQARATKGENIILSDELRTPDDQGSESWGQGVEGEHDEEACLEDKADLQYVDWHVYKVVVVEGTYVELGQGQEEHVSKLSFHAQDAGHSLRNDLIRGPMDR